MDFILNIWRQKNQDSKGKFEVFNMRDVSGDTSFLEMLDQLNEQLIAQDKDCIVFDYDCREGICGACSLVINGYPHGKKSATTACQLYMREYAKQPKLWIEPWRAESFPVIKDLTVNRDALDAIIQAGGYIPVHTGNANEANDQLIQKHQADTAFNAATCIGCGACVAVCPNASASLFVAAKLVHLSALPQGKIQHKQRTIDMLDEMKNQGFGVCSNYRYCEKACPKDISVSHITKMNKTVFSK